ncbi:hypothetical protein ACFL35_11420 [Candidatus Riflebacteria bacterium]
MYNKILTMIFVSFFLLSFSTAGNTSGYYKIKQKSECSECISSGKMCPAYEAKKLSNNTCAKCFLLGKMCPDCQAKKAAHCPECKKLEKMCPDCKTRKKVLKLKCQACRNLGKMCPECQAKKASKEKCLTCSILGKMCRVCAAKKGKVYKKKKRGLFQNSWNKGKGNSYSPPSSASERLKKIRRMRGGNR